MSNQQNIFDTLSKAGIEIPPEFKDHLSKKINDILNYEPRIGVFGKTGVGKSSLCNALFGKDVCPISDIASCTRDPQDVFISITGKGLRLIDVPGVGESSDRDEEYAKLYHKLLPELDLVLWVLKGDDRAFASDESFYKQIVKPHLDQGKAFFIVINQIDKIEPFREWDTNVSQPGSNQAKNIEAKKNSVASYFDLPLNQVIPVSANENFGLTSLIDSIVHALPKDKKLTFINQVPLRNVTKEAIEEAEKGLWDTVIGFVKTIPGLVEIADLAVKGWKLIKGFFS